MSGDIALYVHMPFCRRKCLYCSFISFEKREADISVYLAAMENEMKLRTQGECIRTVYIGGGTPSLIPEKSLGKLFTAIRRLFTIDDNAEISMEANPGTINLKYLKSLRKLGVNRLSLGTKFNDKELALLGHPYYG